MLILNSRAIFVTPYEKTAQPLSLPFVPDRIHWIYDQRSYLQRGKAGNAFVF